ncbi:MAG: alpha,2-fucosyltransferase, partial [Bacteroidetes bacterium]|nr:alpha,2-fucosyltransferase [Bacteroidota bacterium]
MIVVRLIGGLGNQMFQYAAGKALALHHNTHLLIDKIALEQDAKGAFTKRNYALGCFNIDASFATNEQIAFFEEESAGKLKRAFNRMFPAAKKKVVYYESGHRFHENFFTLPQDTYLIGFWQTEKYFGKFQEQIRNDFTLRHPVPEEVEDLLSEIRDTNSTSLHVRRGDYVS